MEMEFTSMLIEVKYGDTVKRFDAPVNESGELDLDLAGLREKISSLFSLPSDGEHILAYFGYGEGNKDLKLLEDKHLSAAAAFHLGSLKAAHYHRIANELERLGKRCRTESTSADSKAKEDEEVFKVECKVREPTKRGFWDGACLQPVVIEVKYGDTLKRFDARVDMCGKLDLDMAGLRAKISGLFSLPSDAELALTYFDKDDDFFTVADDYDLSIVAELNRVKSINASIRQRIKQQKEQLPRGKFEELLNLECKVRATTKCKKVKWYELPPSSGQLDELNKRLREELDDSRKLRDEFKAQTSEMHYLDGKMAKAQFVDSLEETMLSVLPNDGKMSKPYMQMVQTTLEMIMEVPKTPEEFIEKCEFVESSVKGFRESALKALE